MEVVAVVAMEVVAVVAMEVVAGEKWHFVKHYTEHWGMDASDHEVVVLIHRQAGILILDQGVQEEHVDQQTMCQVLLFLLLPPHHSLCHSWNCLPD